jgi:hypothetical protein
MLCLLRLKLICRRLSPVAYKSFVLPGPAAWYELEPFDCSLDPSNPLTVPQPVDSAIREPNPGQQNETNLLER